MSHGAVRSEPRSAAEWRPQRHSTLFRALLRASTERRGIAFVVSHAAQRSGVLNSTPLRSVPYYEQGHKAGGVAFVRSEPRSAAEWRPQRHSTPFRALLRAATKRSGVASSTALHSVPCLTTNKATQRSGVASVRSEPRSAAEWRPQRRSTPFRALLRAATKRSGGAFKDKPQRVVIRSRPALPPAGPPDPARRGGSGRCPHPAPGVPDAFS